MPITKRPVERGKQKRFKVQSDVFVILSRPYMGMGRILVLSVDGMTFEYFTCDEPAGRPSELEIITADRSFHLKNIPCQAIWDLTNDENLLTPIKRRRYGMKFGHLTEAEKAELFDFIDNCTDAASIS